MSREILFRGKRIDNGEWVEGFYVKHGSRHWIYTGEMQYMYLPVCADLPTKYEVSAESVCQYTGLTDKNGRKIFDGDIVEVTEGSLDCDNGKGNVIFYEGLWYVDGEPQNSLYDLRNIGDHEIEVIGNIFDNEELLNK